jgi:hypothetical protein
MASTSYIGKRKMPLGSSSQTYIGDHAAYMPPALLASADVIITASGDVSLPAHSMTLILNCGVFRRSFETLASPDGNPVPISEPFAQYSERDVVRFLRCLYTSADAAADPEDAAVPNVVKLAHTLDASPVLAAARSYLSRMSTRPMNSIDQVVAWVDVARLCEWDDVVMDAWTAMARILSAPIGANSTAYQRTLNDAQAHSLSMAIASKCTRAEVAAVMAILAGNARRTTGTKMGLQEMSNILSRTKSPTPTLSRCWDNTFTAICSMPNEHNDPKRKSYSFESFGSKFRLIVVKRRTQPSVYIACLDASPKMVSCELGIVNFQRPGPEGHAEVSKIFNLRFEPNVQYGQDAFFQTDHQFLGNGAYLAGNKFGVFVRIGSVEDV